MTCKDCYHYDACKFYNKNLPEEYDTIEWQCDNFKDKSLIVELPCEIGTELFLSDNLMQHHRLKEYKFIGTRVVMVIECFEFQRTCKRFIDEHLGKTVFLTKEEAAEAAEAAETKLKERTVMKDIKDIELRLMKDLNNWKEVTKGLYRAVVGTNVCYEIHIKKYEHNMPVLMANASLFLVGEWVDKNGVNFFSRECLLEKQSVRNCIEKAIQDYKKNMS